MPVYETNKNKTDEFHIVSFVQEWMQTFNSNITIQQLPTVLDARGIPRPFPDYKVWDRNVSPAYGEIKYRGDPQYTYDYFLKSERSKHKGYLISTEKLRMMSEYRRRGFKAHLVVKTADKRILFMKEINHGFVDRFQDAPEWMCNTTNNGKGMRVVPQPCKLIRMSHFKLIGIEKHGTG